jgi:DNA gyrase/topoisomerase IV subunit B
MDAEQLAQTTMDKKTRMLLRVSVQDPLIVEKRIGILMGKDASLRRRAWIEENIVFNEEDTFMKEVRK